MRLFYGSESRLQVEFLGTRGNIEASDPLHAKHSGVLVDGKILLDLGEKEYLDRKPDVIFVTHLHDDHAFFVTQEIAALSIPIYAPEKPYNLPELKVAPRKVCADSYTVTSIPTMHSRKVKSTAYLVEHGSQRVLYTGDLVSVDEEYLGLIEDLDLVITDGSFMRRGGLIRRDKASNLIGHSGIPDLVELFRDYTERIIFTHFGSWFYEDTERSKRMIEALGDGVKVESAYDGLVIDL
jgi:Predicted exonuclease of the beta-lactamase fold involved in RNA processing